MRVFTRLWQRVFVYSFLLVIAAGVVGYFLLQRNLTDKASTVVVTFTGELRNALVGQSAEEAARLLLRFNNQEAGSGWKTGRANSSRAGGSTSGAAKTGPGLCNPGGAPGM